MKAKKIALLIITFLSLIIVSCNNDFLTTKNLEVHQLTDTVFIDSNNKQYTVPITLTVDMSEPYTIVSQPRCMQFSSQSGTFSHGTIKLQFTTDMSSLNGQTGYIGQQIILQVKDIGLVQIFVKIGTPYVPGENNIPNLYVSSATVRLKNNEPQTLTIGNTGKGVLNYQINNIPDWLNVTDMTGGLSEGEYKSITFTAKTNNLSETDYSANVQIYFSTIGTTYGLDVKLQISNSVKNPENIKAIMGKVTDAEFNKITNKLLITTQTPNQLVVFSNDTVQSIISLSKAPNCVSISEDGKKAIVGYNQAAVSLIDLESKILVKTYETDCIAYDIVLGDNNWCYIISETGDYKALRSFNLESGESTRSENYSKTYAKMIIRKIPGKPYLLGSNTQISSNGLIMIDISNGIASNIIPYWSVDTNNFWISADGKKIYTGIKNVFRIPEYVKTDDYHYDLPIVAKLQPLKDNIVWVDQCGATGSIFVAESSRLYDTYEYSMIEQFDAESYGVEKQFYPDRFQATVNGNNRAYQTIIKYLFVNKEGTKLFAVKNILEQYKTNAWSMEMIPLN